MRLRRKTKSAPGPDAQARQGRDRRPPDAVRPPEAEGRAADIGGLSARVLIAMARAARRPGAEA